MRAFLAILAVVSAVAWPVSAMCESDEEFARALDNAMRQLKEEQLQKDGPPLTVTYGPYRMDAAGQLHELVVTARIETITISRVSVNRGNCLPSDPHWFGARPSFLPKTLKFGQSIEVGWFFPWGCKPIEMTVGTDRGEFTYSVLPRP